KLNCSSLSLSIQRAASSRRRLTPQRRSSIACTSTAPARRWMPRTPSASALPPLFTTAALVPCIPSSVIQDGRRIENRTTVPKHYTILRYAGAGIHLTTTELSPTWKAPFEPRQLQLDKVFLIGRKA